MCGGGGYVSERGTRCDSDADGTGKKRARCRARRRGIARRAIAAIDAATRDGRAIALVRAIAIGSRGDAP